MKTSRPDSRSARSWLASPGPAAQPRGLDTNTWMTSAPTSAAYASPPVASPPVTVACAPIFPITRSETQPVEPAVVNDDRAAGRRLARWTDAGNPLTEAELLLAVHLEAERHQLLLHLLEGLADQVARYRHLGRSLGDRDGDRRPGLDRRAGRRPLGHDDALLLVAL